MNKVNVAIIGCGMIANRHHIPCYLVNNDVEIACQALTISSLVESWHTILTSNLGQRSYLIHSSTVSMYHRAQGTGSS